MFSWWGGERAGTAFGTSNWHFLHFLTNIEFKDTPKGFVLHDLTQNECMHHGGNESVMNESCPTGLWLARAVGTSNMKTFNLLIPQ
jgi:hypothetical protein